MKSQTTDHELLIKVQETPNPYAIKFITSQTLKETGKATFVAPSECNNLPLAHGLMNLKGVKQIYFTKNTVVVSFNDTVSTEDLVNNVKAVLHTRIAIHNPNFADFDSYHIKNKLASEKTPTRTKDHPLKNDPFYNKVNEILDRTVRSALQADGGDLEVIKASPTEITILYQGACEGCPASMMGTLQAIENILRNELDLPDLTVTPL